MTDSLADLSPSSIIFTADTLQYYLDHRALLQAEVQKGQDLEYGQKLYALIYSKAILKDPMVALMMFQQELLPLTQQLQDDEQGIFSHKLDMTSDLNTITNTAEGIFNKGAKLTEQDATQLAYLLLFLTAIPFASDLNPTVISNIQNAMTDLATNVFTGGSVDRTPAAWAAMIYTEQQDIFNKANNGADKKNSAAVQDIKSAYQDFDQTTGMLTSSDKMLQNDAQTSVNNEKAQLGAYSKMADAQTSFEKAVNRAGSKI